MSSDVQVTWISVVLFCTSDIEGRWIDSLMLLILHLFCQASAFSSSHSFLVHSLSNLSESFGHRGVCLWASYRWKHLKINLLYGIESFPSHFPQKSKWVQECLGCFLTSWPDLTMGSYQVSRCVEVAYHWVCCCQHLPRWMSHALVASGRCYWEGEVVPLKVPGMYLRFRLQKHWDHRRLKHTKTMLEKILQLQG